MLGPSPFLRLSSPTKASAKPTTAILEDHHDGRHHEHLRHEVHTLHQQHGSLRPAPPIRHCQHRNLRLLALRLRHVSHGRRDYRRALPLRLPLDQRCYRPRHCHRHTRARRSYRCDRMYLLWREVGQTRHRLARHALHGRWWHTSSFSLACCANGRWSIAVRNWTWSASCVSLLQPAC